MKSLLLFFSVVVLLFGSAANAHAIEDPLTLSNNKIGIHILFPEEIEEAARLVNAAGDWGYVTIPIQAGDKNLEKWQWFMDQAKQLHVIPLVRLATEGDYFNTKVWRKPNDEDLLDFANFLNSLIWPTKNQYIIVFNEVNRGDEWGGTPDPLEYAEILTYTVTVFKEKSPDFFIISAGLDNASATGYASAINQFDFLRMMAQVKPEIFDRIDGIASHSYPNPGFRQPPAIQTATSITSFLHERSFIQKYTQKNLPIFITETGWSKASLSDEAIAAYYTQAFTNVWTDPNIVAITPFLLRALSGPFTVFSFLRQDGSPSPAYEAVKELTKVKGTPSVATTSAVLGTQTSSMLPVRGFDAYIVKESSPITISPRMKSALKWLLKL